MTTTDAVLAFLVVQQHTLTSAPVQTHDFVLDRPFTLRVRTVTPDGEDATRALRLSELRGDVFHVVGQRERLPGQLALEFFSGAFDGQRTVAARSESV